MSNIKRTLFVFSVDGILCKEYQVILDTLSRVLDAKMEEPIFTLRSGLMDRLQLRSRVLTPDATQSSGSKSLPELRAILGVRFIIGLGAINS